jgi:hypothetical protein
VFKDEKGNLWVWAKTEYFIQVVTKKTDELAIIPCNPLLMEIFEKYKNSPNSLPKSISNQKFNKYLKEACKEADLNDTGRLSINMKAPLCEYISSHTARRHLRRIFICKATRQLRS